MLVDSCSNGFFSPLGRVCFSYSLCSSRALDQFFTLLSGVAEAGVSASQGKKQNRRRLRLQQRARRHNRTTRRHQTIPPPITTNCSSTLPARLHPPKPIPHTPTQTKKAPLSHARGEQGEKAGGSAGRAWGAATAEASARSGRRMPTAIAKREGAPPGSARECIWAPHCEEARACGTGRRTRRDHACAADGGAPRGSARARNRAARREGARVRASAAWTRRLGGRAGGKGDGVSTQAPAKAELQPRTRPVTPVLTVALSTLALCFTCNRQQNNEKKKPCPTGNKKNSCMSPAVILRKVRGQ